MLVVSATSSFARTVKKLTTRDKQVVDAAVAVIAGKPHAGEEKNGDLAGIFVHKFKLNKQEVLLAYFLRPTKAAPEEVVLLSLGSHENFYENFRRKICFYEIVRSIFEP